jgi:hypothetical protein
MHTATLRWRIAMLVSIAIAISYLDRQTLPVAIKAIQEDIPTSKRSEPSRGSRTRLRASAAWSADGSRAG